MPLNTESASAAISRQRLFRANKSPIKLDRYGASDIAP